MESFESKLFKSFSSQLNSFSRPETNAGFWQSLHSPFRSYSLRMTSQFLEDLFPKPQIEMDWKWIVEKLFKLSLPVRIHAPNSPPHPEVSLAQIPVKATLNERSFECDWEVGWNRIGNGSVRLSIVADKSEKKRQVEGDEKSKHFLEEKRFY